jgi:glyoxylase-like metal-dependent hydrolase (beta-lactamase superfamily II)
MLKVTVAAASLALIAGAAFAQDEVEVETYDLGDGIYALYGRGGNLGVSVGEDGIFVIDDQYARMSEPLLAAIGELSEGPIRYVFNTHWHGDHIGGNENFAATGAVIVSHENVRGRMETGLDTPMRGDPIPPSPEAALPVITFSDGGTFYFNGHEARVIHVPHAHTDGDSIIYFADANVLHMGDILFNGFYPFIDVASGGSLDGTIAGLELGLSLADDDTQIIPGHGALATRADMQTAHDVLVDVRGRIAALVAQGMSEEEAVAADPLADLNDEWGQYFINGDMMTAIAYRSLTSDGHIVIEGVSPQRAQAGSRGSVMVRVRDASPSKSKSLPARLSPKPTISRITSSACHAPTIPATAPRMPASLHGGMAPGGGGSG